MPKKQNLKNKGNYVGNLTGKIQEQILQDNRTRASFASLASSYSHWGATLKDSLTPVLKKAG